MGGCTIVPESKSISGNSILSIFGSAWFVISALNSARSGDGRLDGFSGFVKVLVFNSVFKKITKKLASNTKFC